VTVSFALCPLYPREYASFTHHIGCCVGFRAGKDVAENISFSVLSENRPPDEQQTNIDFTDEDMHVASERVYCINWRPMLIFKRVNEHKGSTKQTYRIS
jgi:hypothetical protein